MAVKVQADISQVQARLKKIASTGGSIQPALEAFGSVVLNRIRLGFRMGRSPWGQAWAPLKFRQGRPLLDTKGLRDSITMRVEPTQVLIGTNKVQARVQHFGATIRPKNGTALVFPGPGGLVFARQVTVPARPFMPINRADQADLPPQWAAAGLEAMKKALQL